MIDALRDENLVQATRRTFFLRLGSKDLVVDVADEFIGEAAVRLLDVAAGLVVTLVVFAFDGARRSCRMRRGSALHDEAESFVQGTHRSSFAAFQSWLHGSHVVERVSRVWRTWMDVCRVLRARARRWSGRAPSAVTCQTKTGGRLGEARSVEGDERAVVSSRRMRWNDFLLPERIMMQLFTSHSTQS